MLRVVVMGLGNFGYAFVRRLARQPKVEILAMDRSRETVDAVGAFVRQAVVADCTDRGVLDELEVGSADYVVISLGGEMDASILATLHARSVGARNIWVKAISEDHGRILDLIGASKIIHPEREIAEALAEAVGKPNVLDFIPLGEDYSIVELEPSSEIVGKSLEALDLRNRFGVTVIGVKEYLTGGRRMNPPGTYVVGDDVTLLIMGRSEQIERVQDEAGK
ncbi:MAG TPA: TrkA family potassium uptake protein [Gemmatimonadota bacterium]|nr:TrkA family potassium uptake protein [Gemmatimonadota bacterium]